MGDPADGNPDGHGESPDRRRMGVPVLPDRDDRAYYPQIELRRGTSSPVYPSPRTGPLRAAAAALADQELCGLRAAERRNGASCNNIATVRVYSTLSIGGTVGICVIIPAYNAAATIEAVARETLQQGYPLLVVDDGSSDGTVGKISGLPVNLISHQRNCGKGVALRTGFAWGLQHGFSGMVTLDSDGQHDPSAISMLVEAAREADAGIMLASRFAQFQEMAGLRRHWNCFGAWCMQKRTGFHIDDSQSGFRYYSSRLLRSVTLEYDGYDLEMEILMKGWQAGFFIGSIPINARIADGRATSHFRPVRDTWRICMTFLKFCRH